MKWEKDSMKFKDICNFITWPWPRLLLKLPASVCFGICLLCFLLCIVFYLLPSALLHHTALFLLPMGLSSWIFSKRGACSCFAGSLGFQIGYSTMTMRNLWWPSSILFSLCGMTVMLFLEGSIIVSLRQLLDAAEARQLQAERGERQAAMALEQQRLFNHIKNQFLLHVNHELRTPLTAVSYTLELLQMLNECGSLDHETHTLYLQKAIKQCAELTSIVNNVLDTLHLSSESNPLFFETLSVISVVQDALESREALRHHLDRVTLDIPEYITVRADAQGLLHVLQHLLSNAFKYAPEKTPVLVCATQDLQEPGYTCISVKDYGPGIPPEDLPFLFQQFMRLARDLAGPVHGSGLGLYISKRLIGAMQGQIWVESSGIPGEGSRFCFTLPCGSPTPLPMHVAHHSIA